MSKATLVRRTPSLGAFTASALIAGCAAPHAPIEPPVSATPVAAASAGA